MWPRLSRKPSRGIAGLNKKSSRHILCRDSGLVPGPSVDWPRVCRFGHRSHARALSMRIWQIQGPCSSALKVFALQCRWSPARLADPRGPSPRVHGSSSTRVPTTSTGEALVQTPSTGYDFDTNPIKGQSAICQIEGGAGVSAKPSSRQSAESSNLTSTSRQSDESRPRRPPTEADTNLCTRQIYRPPPTLPESFRMRLAGMAKLPSMFPDLT